MHDKALDKRKGISITITVDPKGKPDLAPETPNAGKPDQEEQAMLDSKNLNDIAPEEAMAEEKEALDAEAEGMEEGQELGHDAEMEDLIMQGQEPEKEVDQFNQGKKPRSIGEAARLELSKKKMSKGDK